MSQNRWVRLYVPDDTPLDRAIFGTTSFVLDEAPRHPFAQITLADDQLTGLFARQALPTPAPRDPT